MYVLYKNAFVKELLTFSCAKYIQVFTKLLTFVSTNNSQPKVVATSNFKACLTVGVAFNQVNTIYMLSLYNVFMQVVKCLPVLS